MDLLNDIYQASPTFWHVVMGLLVFGGMARIAFWSKSEGMRIGGPLALGLALMLTVALLLWAAENGRTILSLGPWAAFILIQAILLLIFNVRRKAKRL